MSQTSAHDTSRVANDNWFTTTHWSVVLAAGQTANPAAEEALEKLCRAYLEGQPAGRVPEANEGNNCGGAEFTAKLVQEVAAEPVLVFESQRRLGSNRRILVLRGEAGRSFRLQVSSDLTHWSTVATVANPDGIVSCLDYPGGAPQRFYRAELVP